MILILGSKDKTLLRAKFEKFFQKGFWMSYICEKTGVVVGPGVPEHKVVVQTRDKTYENPPYKRGKITKGEPNVTYGIEIVREMRVSPEVWTEITGLPPRRLPEKKEAPKREAFSRPVRPKKKKQWKNPKAKGKQGTDRTPKKPVVEVVNTVKK